MEDPTQYDVKEFDRDQTTSYRVINEALLLLSVFMIDVLQLYRIDSYNYNNVVDDVFDDKVHDAGFYTACEGLSAQKK